MRPETEIEQTFVAMKKLDNLLIAAKSLTYADCCAFSANVTSELTLGTRFPELPHEVRMALAYYAMGYIEGVKAYK